MTKMEYTIEYGTGIWETMDCELSEAMAAADVGMAYTGYSIWIWPGPRKIWYDVQPAAVREWHPGRTEDYFGTDVPANCVSYGCFGFYGPWVSYED